jgi:hypothetical protein
MISIKNNLEISHLRGVLVTLFFYCLCSAQNISIENQSDYPIDFIHGLERQTILSKARETVKIGNASEVILATKNRRKILLPVFMNPGEILNININSKYQISFEGDKAALHEYLFEELTTELYSFIVEYQKKYQQNNAKGLIGQSQLNLNKVLQKTRQLIIPQNDNISKSVTNYVINYWLFSVFVSINNLKLGNTEKELLIFYYNNYIKENVEHFSCNTYEQYDVFKRYARHAKELGIKLPKYDIIENSDEDSVNQYLNKSCQAYYFKSQFNYFKSRKDSRAENYKNILKKKFDYIVE